MLCSSNFVTIDTFVLFVFCQTDTVSCAQCTVHYAAQCLMPELNAQCIHVELNAQCIHVASAPRKKRLFASESYFWDKIRVGTVSLRRSSCTAWRPLSSKIRLHQT